MYILFKRFFDIIFALFAICLFLLPWVIIAIIIKLQSAGPVLYKPTRVGLHGKKFTLYKFRSMRADSGKIRLTTLRSDERIFPFGHFLRKSKLDETPQFFNVLCGEMSIIGPRPEDEEIASTIFVGKYKKILSVKPGLSSPASLYDYTHGECYEDEQLYREEFLPKKLDLELYYVSNKSFFYDIKIIFKTIMTILYVLC